MLRTALLILLAIVLTPFALILSQWPERDLVAPAGEGLDFGRIAGGRDDPAPLRHFTARDGARLGYREYPAADPSAPLVVMIHGSGWHGLQFDRLGTRLAEEGLASVIAPDLRGHGPAPERRGDVDHIGQLDEDLADLIAGKGAGREVVLLGHSSGGGFALRFASGPGAGMVDRLAMLAPYLGHAAPSQRPASGGWARPLVRRLIGLGLLNQLGVTALNGLTVLQFRFPRAVLEGPLGATATRSYSYRLNASFSPPADPAAAAPAAPPFIVIAGRADEAFFTDRYAETLGPAAGGRITLIEGVGHLEVVDAAETHAALARFLAAGR